MFILHSTLLQNAQTFGPAFFYVEKQHQSRHVEKPLPFQDFIISRNTNFLRFRYFPHNIIADVANETETGCHSTIVIRLEIPIIYILRRALQSAFLVKADFSLFLDNAKSEIFYSFMAFNYEKISSKG